MINQQRARQIAGEFHGGQWTGLYSFSSTGHVSQEAIDETSQEYNASSIEVDRRGTWYKKMRHNQRNRQQLLSLLNYLKKHLQP